MSKSRDLTAQEAMQHIKTLDKVGDIRSFTKGDSRSTVNKAVESRIDSIKNKKTVKEKPAEKVEAPAPKKTTPAR